MMVVLIPSSHVRTCEFMLIDEVIFYYFQQDDGGGSSCIGLGMGPRDLRAQTGDQLRINMGNTKLYKI